MEPVSHLTVTPPVPVTPPTSAPSPPETIPQEVTQAPPAVTQSPQDSTTWKQRGYFHLNRREFDLALEAFTKALQEAESQQDKKLMAASLSDLGFLYLEKQQRVFAAKIFNGALALIQSSDQESRKTILSQMLAVDRGFLASVGHICNSLRQTDYLERRNNLADLRHNRFCEYNNRSIIYGQIFHSLFLASSTHD